MEIKLNKDERLFEWIVRNQDKLENANIMVFDETELNRYSNTIDDGNIINCYVNGTVKGVIRFERRTIKTLVLEHDRIVVKDAIIYDKTNKTPKMIFQDNVNVFSETYYLSPEIVVEKVAKK